jgi:hypothetical protein
MRTRRSSEPPPRLSAQRRAAVRACPVRSTLTVGGGRSPFALAERHAVKMRLTRAVVAVALGIGVGAAFLAWYPFLFSLAWPGLVMARVGVPHSWLFAVVLMVSLLVWFGLRSRSRPWWQAVTVSLLGSAGYCAVAFFYLARLPVPLPAFTPYDSAPEQRAAYLQSYDSGYRDGMSGILRTYCFYPEAETRGFYDGAYRGSEVWYLLLGRRMPERHKRLLESSAARDGVRVELKGNGQPDGPANGSQPIRSETNSTSSAAGSRR